jgi:hypothetical protein
MDEGFAFISAACPPAVAHTRQAKEARPESCLLARMAVLGRVMRPA